MRSRTIALVLALALAAAVLIAFFVKHPRVEPKTPTSFVPDEWSRARTSPMHEAHVGKKSVPCTKCHENGFDKAPSMDVCTGCHANEASHAHRGSATSTTPCVTCHAFAADAREKTCVSCHAGDGVGAKGHALASHASDRATCTSCHAMHAEKKTRVDARAECTQCHEVRVSHGHFLVAALPPASPTAAGAPDSGNAESDSGKLALRLPDLDAGAASPTAAATVAVCTTCHTPHASKSAARSGCATCHAPKVAKPHEACTTCHAPHAATREAAKPCASCHAAKVPSPGHVGCTGCHAPHDPLAARGACASCHKGHEAFAATRVAAHADCTSCHAPHANPNVNAAVDPRAFAKTAAAACAKCHAGVHPDHPASKTGEAASCIDCHAPHTQDHAVVSTCSSCHTKATSDLSFHAAAAPRGHDLGKKTSCRDCHAPHAFAIGKEDASRRLCAKCHASEASVVRKGHDDCKGCHGVAHTPTAKPACASCHAAEVASAPKGHTDCVKCHDAHSGSLGKVTPAASTLAGARAGTCPTCHADKERALHGHLPGAGCASCHRPHGPNGGATPPPCTSCHAPAKLPGLHAVGQHAAKCASCHASHSAPRADRATCTSGCHTDRRAHQPEAAVCTGCHVFRK